MMLWWYDDNPKKPTAQKIAEGCAAYLARWGKPASVVLVNEREQIAIDGLDIRPLARIGVNNFHIGFEGAPDAPPR